MFARLLPAALFLTLPALAAGAAEPVPPSLFTLSDPTLEVTVWAHSPLFFNPTNIDIDKDGCVWDHHRILMMSTTQLVLTAQECADLAALLRL